VTALTPPTMSAPSGLIATRRPTISWNPGVGAVTVFAEIFILNAAPSIPSGSRAAVPAVFGGLPPWYPNYQNLVYDSAQQQTFFIGNSYTPTVDLPAGNLWAMVMVANPAGAGGYTGVAWNTIGPFSLTDTPPVPTAITPGDTATVQTNVPQLAALLGACSHGSRVRAHWQLATSGGFVTNLRDVYSDDLVISGPVTKQVPEAVALHQTTWYMRCREENEGGETSAWSATTSFTVAHAPSAGGLVPTGAGFVLAAGGAMTLAWQFADPSPDDVQTSYQAIIEKNSDGSSVLNTGQVVSGAAFAAVNIGTGLFEQVLRWRVRLWDGDGVAGAYSANQLFVPAAAGPTVTIVDPTPAEVEATALPSFTATATYGGGRDFDSARVVVTNTGTGKQVWDSGWQRFLTLTPATAILVNSSNYSATFSVRDTAGLVGSSTVAFSSSWAGVSAVAFTVDDTYFRTLGFVTVRWDNSTEDVDRIAWRVYRRAVGASSWELVVEDGRHGLYFAVADFGAPANVASEYAVVQVAQRFESVVESAYVPSSITPADRLSFWLIGDAPVVLVDTTPPVVAGVVPVASFRLYAVQGDTWSTEVEQAEIPLAGRGRVVEYGTVLGKKGTVDATVYDDDLVGGQLAELEALHTARTSVLLRNPHGYVWKVATGDMTITPVGGQGSRLATVSIPYSETV